MTSGDNSRMPTHVWVEAEMRRLSSLGIGVFVTAKGDLAGGMVIQKIADMAGKCRLLGQQRDLLGAMVWVNLLQDDVVGEKEADAYLARARTRDPDLWIIEIEDRAMEAALQITA